MITISGSLTVFQENERDSSIVSSTETRTKTVGMKGRYILSARCQEMFSSGLVFSGPGSLEHHECPPLRKMGFRWSRILENYIFDEKVNDIFDHKPSNICKKLLNFFPQSESSRKPEI